VHLKECVGNVSEEDVIDAEKLFNVIVTDEDFIVERSQPMPIRTRSREKNADGDEEHEDSFEVLNSGQLSDLEDIGVMVHHEDLDLETKSPLSSPSPLQQRRLIKSLPRVFRNSKQQLVPNAEESKLEDGLASTSDDDKHRRLLKDLSRRFRNSKEKLLALQMSQKMVDLELAILDRDCRKKLIDSLLTCKEDLLVKVHFCNAVHEWELISDWRMRKGKAQTIVRMFVHKDSMFHLQGIPQNHERQLLDNCKYEYLDALKVIFLEELSGNELVMDALRGFRKASSSMNGSES